MQSTGFLLKPFAGLRGRIAESNKNMSMTFVESIAHAVALSNNFLPEPSAGLRGRSKNHTIEMTLVESIAHATALSNNIFP